MANTAASATVILCSVATMESIVAEWRQTGTQREPATSGRIVVMSLGYIVARMTAVATLRPQVAMAMASANIPSLSLCRDGG